MPMFSAFLADDLGALRVDRVVLGAGALILLAMSAAELFDAAAELLVSAVEPSLDEPGEGRELATVEQATMR